MFSIIIPGGSDASQSSSNNNTTGTRATNQTPTPTFPTYLLPSFPRPFRRRRQSSNSVLASPPAENHVPDLCVSPVDDSASLASPVDAPSTPPSWPSAFPALKGNSRAGEIATATNLSRVHPDTIKCAKCATDLAFGSQIVSKAFHGRFGRAYLVSPPERDPKASGPRNLINIRVGKPQARELVTGTHVVADIFCVICQTQLGWKYIDASDPEQAYKVGKFILELRRTVVYRSWEDAATSTGPLGGESSAGSRIPASEDAIVFNSDDEDECEDIFSGTWSPELAKKRRSKKSNRLAWQTST